MKPAPFEYHRAYSVDEAVALLTELGEDAKIIAGGQSLAPMMNFRLARPTALVDINPITGLDHVLRDGDNLRVGALTRHRDIETTRDAGVRNGFGVLPRAAHWIGHFPIRCRGTVGGSMAHSDPTAEWCLLALLHEAHVVLRGPAGTREVPVDEWFTGFLTTSAQPDEMLVETVFRRPRAHSALTEFARRKGDFAITAAAVAFDVVEDRMSNVGVVLGGVAGEPFRAREAEEALEGARMSSRAAVVTEAARIAADTVEPPSDLNGDSVYRKRLVETLTARAVEEAFGTGTS